MLPLYTVDEIKTFIGFLGGDFIKHRTRQGKVERFNVVPFHRLSALASVTDSQNEFAAGCSEPQPAGTSEAQCRQYYQNVATVTVYRGFFYRDHAVKTISPNCK